MRHRGGHLWRCWCCLLSAALALQACHLVAPYEPKAERDARVDPRPPDQGRPDRAMVHDRQVNPRPDAPPLDQRAPDKARPDKGGCLVASTLNPKAATCAKQCLNPAKDSDCDGLPNTRDRDPDKAKCHRLLVNDDLRSAPNLPGSLWATKGKLSWSCGKAELQPGTQLELVKAPSLTSNKLLVELKFSFGAKTSNTSWDVRITTGHGPSVSGYACHVLVASYQKTPGFRLGWGGCSGNWGPVSGLSDTTGKSYFLQSYWSGSKQVCRLLDAAGKKLAEKPMYNCPKPAVGAGIRISTSNRHATVHHVRVFRVP